MFRDRSRFQTKLHLGMFVSAEFAIEEVMKATKGLQQFAFLGSVQMMLCFYNRFDRFNAFIFGRKDGIRVVVQKILSYIVAIIIV